MQLHTHSEAPLQVCSEQLLLEINVFAFLQSLCEDQLLNPSVVSSLQARVSQCANHRQQRLERDDARIERLHRVLRSTHGIRRVQAQFSSSPQSPSGQGGNLDEVRYFPRQSIDLDVLQYNASQLLPREIAVVAARLPETHNR